MESPSQLSLSSEEIELHHSFSVRCRICHAVEVTSTTGEMLESPCECRGSMSFVHLKCLERWLKSNRRESCEICNFKFRTKLRRKPLKEWQFRPVFQSLSPDQRALLCLGVANFFLLIVEIPFLYFVVDLNGEFFQKQTTERGDGLRILPFLLLSLLVFTLIFIATSTVFLIAGCKAFANILRYNSEIVLVIPNSSRSDHVVLCEETIV